MTNSWNKDALRLKTKTTTKMTMTKMKMIHRLRIPIKDRHLQKEKMIHYQQINIVHQAAQPPTQNELEQIKENPTTPNLPIQVIITGLVHQRMVWMMIPD